MPFAHCVKCDQVGCVPILLSRQQRWLSGLQMQWLRSYCPNQRSTKLYQGWANLALTASNMLSHAQVVHRAFSNALPSTEFSFAVFLLTAAYCACCSGSD